MLSPKIQEALSKQINAELFSEYLYLSMSAYFEAESFKGMAQWMRAQAGEEHGHAMKIFDFVNDRDGRVTLTQIEAPKIEWKSPLDVFEDALKHEQKVTGLINDLSNLAYAEKDHASHDFLEWFVKEQVEEESVARTIVDQLKLVGNDGTGLYMIDRQLGQRGSTPSPAPAT
ncbi:MAG: ferritin [Thermoguttaceae bacterium]|jgi:ferritin